MHRKESSLGTIFLLLSLAGASAFALTAESSSSDTDLPSPEAERVVEGAPTFREVLDLRSVGSVAVAPDGSAVAWTVRSTDWDENRYDTEIWLAKRVADGSYGEPFQFTRTADGSSTSPAFSPDGQWLGFVSSRPTGEAKDDPESQLFRIPLGGGEAQPLTSSEEGVQSFAWSPDSRYVAYLANEKDETAEQREKSYGSFHIEDDGLTYSHLFLQENVPDAEARQLTSGEDFSVDALEFSPDGKWIAIEHRPRPQIDDFPKADLSLVSVETGERRDLVTQAGGDSLGFWSPDGSSLLFGSPMGGNDYYGNSELGLVDIASGAIESLSESFDESANATAWHAEHGILFVASQRTRRSLFRLDPATGTIERLELEGDVIGSSALSRDGSTLAWTSESGDRLSEVFVASATDLSAPQQLTRETDQVADWPLGTREVTTWTSRDGTEIEGVLYLPEGHDRTEAAPLMVVIHGGPTGTSRPDLIGGYVYPIEQWLAKRALVLMPNYRGSAGYGEDFRALNVRNLGVGDAWDVESGVDALVESGLVDPTMVGAMGWSQGGYISAFLATTSDRFKAISNGAGISNWMTYYVNTDIHGFTRQYLEATPWDDPEVYAKTSPMTYIKGARTPTLIQHGEFDERVPPPNAFELYQGLQDVGVPTRLILYHGFGHGITKPKERLAAVWHNWQWFERWMWGNEVELPLPAEADRDEAGDESP